MNVGIGTVAAQFLSWEYLIRIFGIVSFQCADERVRNTYTQIVQSVLQGGGGFNRVSHSHINI